MSIKLFLKAASELDLMESLKNAGLIRTHVFASGVRHALSRGVYLDLIGEIFRHDVDGTIIEHISGCHANLLCVQLSDEQMSLLPIIPEPRTPFRIFA